MALRDDLAWVVGLECEVSARTDGLLWWGMLGQGS